MKKELTLVLVAVAMMVAVPSHAQVKYGLKGGLNITDMSLNHVQIGANYNIVCGKTGELEVVKGVKTAFNGRANAWQIHAAYYF